MVLRPEDDRIENANNNNGDSQCFIPVITNGSIIVLDIFKHIINSCNDNDVKSDNH